MVQSLRRDALASMRVGQQRVVAAKMKRLLLMLFTTLALLTPGCGPKELGEQGKTEWHSKLEEVAGLMKRNAKVEEILPYVRESGRKAHLTFPYFEEVMGHGEDEDQKAAALLLMTIGFFLVNNGQLEVPGPAMDHIESMQGNSPAAAPLLENQDLVPLYRDYPFTLDK